MQILRRDVCSSQIHELPATSRTSCSRQNISKICIEHIFHMKEIIIGWDEKSKQTINSIFIVKKLDLLWLASHRVYICMLTHWIIICLVVDICLVHFSNFNFVSLFLHGQMYIIHPSDYNEHKAEILWKSCKKILRLGHVGESEPTYYDFYECRIVVLINQKISIIAQKIKVIFFICQNLYSTFKKNFT